MSMSPTSKVVNVKSDVILHLAHKMHKSDMIINQNHIVFMTTNTSNYRLLISSMLLFYYVFIF